MVKYDITTRSLLKNEGKPDELVVRRFTAMTAEEVSQWVQQMMNECILALKVENILDLDTTEEEIVESFNRLIEVINEMEQIHNPNSVTYKILKTYTTVQVIFPKEEST